MDNQVLFEVHLQDTTCMGKEVVYVLLITSILRRLPVAWAGETGTILFCLESAITVAVATVHIATTTTSSALIQAEGLKTTA